MNVDDLLREAAAQMNARLEQQPIPPSPSRLSDGRRWWVRAMAAIGVVTVIGSVAWLSRDSATDEVIENPPSISQPTPTAPSTSEPSGPLFGDTTDVVFLYDDGLDGVLAVDPDRRFAARSPLEGQRAGDQPYRLHQSGSSVVVGWSTITAVDITTREPTPLGDATIFIPGAEEGTVWLVDFRDGAISPGGASVRLVDISGAVLREQIELNVEGIPGIGIPDGIALETDDGVVLWDEPTNARTRRLGSGEGVGLVGDSTDDLLAWCTDDCSVIHIIDLNDGSDTATSGPRFDIRSARFSPDGTRLAVSTADDVWIINPETNQVDTFKSPATEAVSLAWSPDGQQLFASAYGYGQSSMRISRYRPGTQQLETITLPFGGGMGFAVIPAELGGPYFDLGSAGSCSLPTSCTVMF